MLDILKKQDSIEVFQSQYLKTPDDFKHYFFNVALENTLPSFPYLQIENNSLHKMFIKLFRIPCVIERDIYSTMLVLLSYTY